MDSAAEAVAEAVPAVDGKYRIMLEYIIDVTIIEELQTLNDKDQLEQIFFKAKSTVVNGEKVLLVRKDKQGQLQKFDEITSLEDLQRYRQTVFKYL